MLIDPVARELFGSLDGDVRDPVRKGGLYLREEILSRNPSNAEVATRSGELPERLDAIAAISEWWRDQFHQPERAISRRSFSALISSCFTNGQASGAQV